MGCARVGMDAGDWHSRGDRPWKGHSPAARAAIPALKGQDHSAQGNALVVLHISVLIDWWDQPPTGCSATPKNPNTPRRSAKRSSTGEASGADSHSRQESFLL